MQVGDIVKIKELEDISICVGGCLYYSNDNHDELIYDARYKNTRPPFGKTMIIVKIDSRMNDRCIAVSAVNKQKDWKYWWWIPQNYIKEIIKK
jgi:hypothetical protein